MRAGKVLTHVEDDFIWKVTKTWHDGMMEKRRSEEGWLKVKRGWAVRRWRHYVA
jgi:hypothetical protein